MENMEINVGQEFRVLSRVAYLDKNEGDGYTYLVTVVTFVVPNELLHDWTQYNLNMMNGKDEHDWMWGFKSKEEHDEWMEGQKQTHDEVVNDIKAQLGFLEEDGVIITQSRSEVFTAVCIARV